MEDIIDEYFYLIGEQRGRTWKDYLLRLLQSCQGCCSLAKAWHDIDSKLENMEKHLSVLARAKDLFGNANRVKNSESDDTHHYRADSPMLIDEDDLVGIEDNKSKLVSWLTNADTRREKTEIAVWGMAGQGKTTLLANVYRNDAVKSHFDCQVWATISQTYSVEELLRTMIQEIFKEKKEPVPYGIATMQRLELFEIIRESLQGKRYIIVLDDVWQVDLWNDISRAFIDSNNGSRIVVTTRWYEVARMANEEYIMELQQLNEKDAWTLFCKKAFGRENSKDCPKELEDYTGRILNKCGGSPLAIVAIASLLSFKEKSEPEWKKVHDRLHWEFENNPALNKVKNIINLSFNDLPCYLKNCFVYCSIFPEDYLIQRKKLILLWVAEGFVEARSSNRSMEEEAEDYLAELMDRSMLQLVESNASGRLKAFRMHNVVREFRLPERVLISFKTLRVLELQGVRISNLPNEVSALFNLHYLGLTDTKVERLPNNIQKLQSLQTLDLRGSRIKKLPHGVTQLKHLRHLFATGSEVEFGRTVVGCFPTLEGACQWKNLQTLQSVKANQKLVQLMGDMKELRSLKVVEVEQAHCPQLFTSLTKMSNLRYLLLNSDASEGLNFEMLNYPPPLLQKLDLSGRLFEGKMSTFICSWTKLTRVHLYATKLIEDPLPSFGQLPKLAEFRLMHDAYDGQKLHFKISWFVNLKRLFVQGLKNLNDIVIEEGAMINLCQFVMINDLELKMVPHGIEFLTHLKSLFLEGMSEELRKKN